MVDSNLQRERVLPSEKAFAYTSVSRNDFVAEKTFYGEDVR